MPFVLFSLTLPKTWNSAIIPHMSEMLEYFWYGKLMGSRTGLLSFGATQIFTIYYSEKQTIPTLEI